MRRRDKAGRVLVLPNQVPELISKYGLSRAQVDREVWAIALDGTRWSGAAAINRILQELGSGWSVLAAISGFWLIQRAEDRGYRWVADHRSELSRWLGAPPEWKE